MKEKVRSAEEIAREMVGEVDVMMSMAGPHVYAFAIGDLFCSYEDPDIARLQRETAIALLAATIEQSRTEGAVAVLDDIATKCEVAGATTAALMLRARIGAIKAGDPIVCECEEQNR